MKQFNKILKAITIVILFAFSTQTITAQQGDWEWLLAAGRGGNDWANDMVRDQQENLYITGAFTHTAIFGKDVNGNTVTLTSLPSSLERFVAKYNKAGQCLWVKSICKIKASNSNRKGSITIDNLGNLFVGGTIYGDVINGTDTLLHYQRGVYSFVSSFSQADGNLKWIRIAGSGATRNDTLANEAYCTSLAPDNQGGVYSAGYFMEEMYIDSTANQKTYVKANTLSYSSFLLKYNDAGNLQWKRLIKGNTGWGAGVASIKTNSKGNVFVTGNVSGNQYIETDGQGGLDSLITDPYSAQYLISDVFILKYSPDGIFKEKTRIGGENRQSPNDLFIDQYDNMFITGNFQYYANFSGNTVTAEGSTDIFILKLDTSFNLQWDKYIQGVGEEIASYVIANDNNVYITGYFDNTIYFTETDYTTNDSLRDIFIAKYDKADGTFLSALQAGGTLNDEGWGIAVDDCENIYATGYFTSPSYFGDDTLSGSTYREIFLGKYNVHYADFILDSSICPNIPFNLATTNLAPTQYALNWSTAETDSNQIIISPSITTSYIVTISDANGCTASDRAIISMLDSSFCYVKLQDAYCNIVNISPDKTLYADTIQGAEMYEFWVYNENENYTLKSYDNSLALYKIQTLGSGQTYNVKVRIMKNEVWGEWGNACTINIMEYEPDGELVYSFNPIQYDKLNGTEYIEPIKIFDRFGNDYTLDEISVENRADKYGEQVFGSPTPHIITAGIFKLYIEDVTSNTGIGFDDSLYGRDRQHTLAQVFLDLSELIVRHSNMGNQKVRIYIEKSNYEIPDYALAGASQYYSYGNGEFKKKGNIELFIQSGNDPSKELLKNGVFNDYFHGYLVFNFANSNDWENNIEEVIGDKFDLYSVTLHESMHLLGFSSLILDYEGNGLNNSFSSFAANMVYQKENNSFVSILIEDSNKYILNTPEGVVLNEGCDPPTLYYESQCALDNTYVPIYNPVTYKSGSSLSHFNCEGITEGYVMNYAKAKDDIQRYLHKDEVSVLHDIGYTINNKYGAKDSVYYINDSTFQSIWINDTYEENQEKIIALKSYSGECSKSIITVIGINDVYEDTVFAGSTIILNVNDIIYNDEKATGIIDVKIMDGGFTNQHLQIFNQGTANEYYKYTIPEWFLDYCARIQYTPINVTDGKTTKGTPAFIYVKVKRPLLIPCDKNKCNMVCYGEFNDLGIGKNVYPFNYHTDHPLSFNSLDLFRETYINTNFIGCGNTSNILKDIDNNTGGFIGIAANAGNRESIYLPLNKPIIPGETYRFTFRHRLIEEGGTCKGNLMLFGSQNLPCIISEQINLKDGLTINECEKGNPFTVHELINDAPIGGISTWTEQTKRADSSELIFTYNGSEELNYIFLYVNPFKPGTTIQSDDIYILLDDIELHKVDQRKITINRNLSNTNPCIGDNVTITYTIEREDTPDDILTLQADVLGNGLKIISEEGEFDNSGKIRIYPNDWQGNYSIQKTLTLEVTNDVTPGSPIYVELNILSEQQCMDDTQEKVSDIITPGVSAIDNISITKNIENKKTVYHQGDEITYSIVLENNGNLDITEIVILDTIPDLLQFISADTNVTYEKTGNIIRFKNINLSANPITNFASIQYTCIIDSATYTCNKVTNRAYLIEGRGLCRLSIQAEQEIYITNDTVEVQVSDDASVCKGDSTTLTASGGTSYTWSNGNTTSSTTVFPNETTTYTVTTNTPNCTITDNVVVNVLLSELNLGEDKTICNGESYTINATGGSSYTWSNGNTTSSITVSPSETTTYIVTAYIYACSATDQIVISVINGTIPNVNITSTQTTICDGDSITLTASGGNTYSWSNGNSGAEIDVSPTKTTIYTVTTITSSGCSGTDNIVITVNPIPTANAGIDKNICYGQTTTLTASGGGTYSWSNGDTTTMITISPTVTTTYIVTVTNSICSNTSDVIVFVIPNPIANAGVDQAICLGNSTTLTASGGTAFVWEGNIYEVSINVTPSQTTTYSVTVINNGCTASDNVEVIVITDFTTDIKDLTTNIEGYKNICIGDEVTLTAISSELSESCTYSWSNGDTTSNININPMTSTTYKVTVTHVSGCTASNFFEVYVYTSFPTVNVSADQSICKGESATPSTQPALPGYTFIWNTGSTSPSLFEYPSATTTYTVTVKYSSCSASDDVVYHVYPELNVSPDVSILQGDTTILTASGGGTYSWSTGVTTPSISVSPTVTTTYRVTVSVTSPISCSATDNIIVTVNSITANAGDDQTICSGDTTTLTATGDGDTYSWSTAETTASINVSPTATTTYTVTATKNGCTASDAVVVTIGQEATTWNNTNAKTIIQNNLFPQGEKTVRINDSLLVDTTLTLDDYTLRISSLGKIIIKEQGKLILNRCTLEAGQCLNDSMWAGIFLEGTYKIDTITVGGVPYTTKITDTLLNASVSIDSSIIRNAHSAIVSTNGGAIYANSSTFENNERNIVYKEHQNNYWKTFPFNLVLEGNKFVNNSESITSLSGVEISGLNNLVQTIIAPTNQNEFDNLQKGIVIYDVESIECIPIPNKNLELDSRINIYIYNNFFDNIADIAIDIENIENTFTLSEIKNCEITNSRIGISIKNSRDFYVIKNNISTARNCIKLNDVGGYISVGSGYGYESGEGIDHPSQNILTIDDEENPPTGGSGEYFEYDAISASYTTTSNAITVFNINNNKINVKNGINAISVINLKEENGLSVNYHKMSYNTITMEGTKSYTRRGFYIGDCEGGYDSINFINKTSLANNYISKLDTTDPSDENIIGILSNVTSAFNIKSNIINQAGKAIRMLGESEKNKLSCNEMTNCNNGVYFYAAVIDDQGDTLASTCNEWNSVTDLQRVTGSLNSQLDTNGFPIRTNWHYRDSITEENPKIIAGNSLIYDITPKPQAASCVCISTKSNKGSNKPKLQTKSDTLIAIRQYLLEPTVKGTLRFEKYNDEYVYQYNKKAMRILANNPELININGADDNNLYENFYNKHINSNIGEFLNVENSIKKSSVSTRGAVSEKKQQARTAKQLNSRINPKNLLEAYQQTVNNVLLNMAEGKEIDEATRSELIAIARQKAYVYGDAVFQARVLLGINFVDEEESTDNNMENKIGEESTPKNYPLSIINSQFNIFPNPSDGEIIVEYTGDSLCNATFELYNIYGSKLIEEKINSKKQRINLRNLENAVYIYQINNCNIIENRNKLIINK